jgi:hypothetical protein
VLGHGSLKKRKFFGLFQSSSFSLRARARLEPAFR